MHSKTNTFGRQKDSFIFLVDKSLHNITIFIDATVAKERPPTAHILAMSKVYINNYALLLIGCRAIEHFALRTYYHRRTPELYSLSLSARVRFEAYTVDRNDWQSVGNGMSTLHSCPSLALALLLFVWVIGGLTYGCRINQEFCTLQSHKACSLGIPLVPAYEHAKLAHAGLNRMKTEVARCEIEFLIETRVIRNVHLTILSRYSAILFHHHRGIVINTRSTTLEQ